MYFSSIILISESVIFSQPEIFQLEQKFAMPCLADYINEIEKYEYISLLSSVFFKKKIKI